MGSCLPQSPTLHSVWVWEALPKRSSKFSQLPDAIQFFCYLLKSSNNTGKKTAEFSLGAHNTLQKGLEHAGLLVPTVYQFFSYLNSQTTTTPRSVWQMDPEDILFLFNPGESTDPFKFIPHKTGWPLKDHLGNHVNSRTCWASESHFHIISHHRKTPQPMINHAQDSGVTYHRAKKFQLPRETVACIRSHCHALVMDLWWCWCCKWTVTTHCIKVTQLCGILSTW